MKIDIKKMSSHLADDSSITDYDFWRALKTVDQELYRTQRQRQPIPIDLVFARRILSEARSKRRGTGR